MTNSLAIFEGHKIRRYYNEKTETWYFSVVDIIAVLTDQDGGGAQPHYMDYGVAFNIGLTITTTGAALDLTITYE